MSEPIVGRNVRVGVAGLRRGLSFLRLFAQMPDIDVVALIDPDVAQRRVAKALVTSSTPILEFDYVENLLESPPAIDFVVLSTPPIGRVADVERLLAANVSVLSEIPAVWTKEEAERLIAAVKSSSAEYMMAENCAYWGFVTASKAMRERGDFGKVFYAEAEMSQDMRAGYRDAAGNATWRLERKNPITYCTHSIGPLLRITGRRPVEVICVSSSSNYEEGIADAQTALIKLDDGSLLRVTISLSNAHWFGHRFALFGTTGSLDTGWLMDDQPRYWTESIPNLASPIRLPIGPDVPGVPPAARKTGEAAMNWLMARDFIESQKAGRRPPMDVYEALTFSMPGVLAAESAAQGGKAIAIPDYQAMGSAGR